jgi:hypothetical protein
LNADFQERGGNLVRDGLMWRDGDLVPGHAGRVDLAGQRRDGFGRRSAAQHQRRAELLEAGLQRPQRLRQPPARGASQRPCTRRTQRKTSFVEHIEADHRSAALCGGGEGGVIRQAQIVAKPDDMGAGDLAGHQLVSTRKAENRSRRDGPGFCNPGRSGTYRKGGMGIECRRVT